MMMKERRMMTGLMNFDECSFNTFQDGGKKPPPQNLSHISYSDETWHTYTLPKEDEKISKSRDTLLEFC